MYKYRNENNKAIGTDGWHADREESRSCIYTGLWNDSVLVGLIVEHMGDDDSHHEMVARFHSKAQDVVKRCNAYDELLAIQAQLVAALGRIYKNECEVFDEETNGMVICCMDTDDMMEVARAALAAAGAQP